MLFRRRIATTILLLVLGLALLGQPSAFSTPKGPHRSETGSQVAATPSPEDSIEPVTTLPLNEDEVTPTTEPLAPGETVVSDESGSTSVDGSVGETGADGETVAEETTTTVPTTTTEVVTDELTAGSHLGEEAVDLVLSDLTVSTTSSKVLAQVGERIDYTTHVTNNSTTDLSGVTVVAVLQPELSAQSFERVDEVDAATIGSSARGDDVVWVLKDLAPGATADLPWVAKVAKRGNLRTFTATKTVAPAKTKAPDTTTYLATAGRRAPHNPVPMVQKKVVTYHSEVVPAEEQPLVTVAPATGTTEGASDDGLPFTGLDAMPLLLLGVFLIVMGIGLALAPRAFDRRKIFIVMLVGLTACVASNQDQAGPDTTDKVKGKRITNTTTATTNPTEITLPSSDGNGNGNGNGAGGGEGPATTTTLPVEPPTGGTGPGPTTVAQAPAPTVTTIVRDASLVTVPFDGPSEVLQSRPGDNQVTLDWSDASGVESAASSAMFNADSPVEILSSLSEGKGTVVIDVTLRNIQDDKRLVVKGRLFHVVEGAGGKIATLRSDPLDLVLNPNGVAEAHFTYRLPTGSYSLSSSFEAASRRS